MTIHQKKCTQAYFKDLWEELRHSEIRRNNCDYQIGDIIIFREVRDTRIYNKYNETIISSEEYTGRAIKVKITHIATKLHGLKRNRCLLTFDVIGKTDYDA